MLCITNNSIKHLSFVYTVKTSLFQIIQFSVSLCVNKKLKIFVYVQLNVKAVLCLTIQFSLMSNSSICPIDRILSGATTPGLSKPGSDDNEGGLRIPQSSSITKASPSDYLVSYLGSCTSAEMLSAYYAAPTDCARNNWYLRQNGDYLDYSIIEIGQNT